MTTWRTCDLIGATVYDSAGRHLGKVHDLRIGRGGGHETDAPYAVTHLLVAAGTIGTRLGYGYGHMNGPWPLGRLLARGVQSGYAVEWRQIASLDRKNEIRLAVPREQVMTMGDLLQEQR